MPLLHIASCFVGMTRLHCHSQARVGLSFKAQLDVAATIVQHHHLLVPPILHGCTASSSTLLLLRATCHSQQAGADVQDPHDGHSPSTETLLLNSAVLVCLSMWGLSASTYVQLDGNRP